jgi:hypothetical protein
MDGDESKLDGVKAKSELKKRMRMKKYVPVWPRQGYTV